MTHLHRFYDPLEASKDGYPREWHDLGADHELARYDPETGKRLKFGIKHMVRESSDHRCVRCMHPYRGGGEWTPCDQQCLHGGPVRIDGREIEDAHVGIVVGMVQEARWRILTVHHLDGVKLNCRWWNLAPLCQRCHLTVQGKVKMERVWPWEHTDWFKPYVAGYYALTYLGEDLTRDETEARLDELLSLELQAGAA